jgi:histidine triad (HIT) family protein
MEDCIFCKIVTEEIPSRKVYEDEHSFAFLDINPRNPGHTLVVSKAHVENIFDLEEDEAAELMKSLRRVAIGVKQATGTEGISICQSNGQLAGQAVPHIHFHIIPRTEAEKGIGLEAVLPVKKQDDATMEEMAKRISEKIPQEKPEPEPQEEPEEEVPQEKGKESETPEKQDINFDF